MKTKLILAAITLMTSAGLPANAQNSFHHQWNYGHDNRDNRNESRNFDFGSIDALRANEQNRITMGLRDGSLSRHEGSRLQGRLNRISALEAQMRASDGRLSMRERITLQNELNRLSEAVYRERHDFR